MEFPWQWLPTYPVPETVLVVMSRTVYTPEGWDDYLTKLDPAAHKLLQDPRVLGLSLCTDEREGVSWGISAWRSFEDLEECAHEQIAWLKSLIEVLKPSIRARHNAYRFMDTNTLPPSWEEVMDIIDSVRKASPLGADAFPELSRMLGLNGPVTK